jgi:type IV pilus assembly protein PilO
VNKAGGKSLKPPVLIALIVVGVLCFAGLGWLVLVRPQGDQVKQLKTEQADVQRQIDDQRRQTAAARSAPEIRVADVYRLAKAMPDKTDMPDLLLELSQLARGTGIEFNSITPAPVAPLTGYTVIPITVTFNGNFFNLADFLYRLRTLVDVHNSRLDATGRLFTVDTVSFSESPQQFPQIQATLLIDAFVYGTAAVPGAPTTSAPTATTTTTSTETTSTTTTTPPTQSAASAAPAGAP